MTTEHTYEEHGKTLTCSACILRGRGLYVDECGVECCHFTFCGDCPATTWSETAKTTVLRAEYLDPTLIPV